MSIGERIIQVRKERGITQSGLAKLMDVSRQAVSKWENDQTAPDTLKLIQLSDVLGTDVEYLATGVHRPQPEPKIITVIEKVDNVIEKIIEVEKPVVVEKIVEVERRVEIPVETPVIRKVYRTRYLRNPLEFLITGAGFFLLGLLIGCFLL